MLKKLFRASDAYAFMMLLFLYMKWERVRSHLINNSVGFRFRLFRKGQSVPDEVMLFLHFVIPCVQTFYDLVGYVEFGINIECRSLEKDGVITAGLVVGLDKSVD